LIRKISAERIRQETTKMITGPNPDKAIEMIQDTGLLEQFLPEVSGLDGVEQAPENHPEGDAFRHTLIVLSLLKNPSEELAWAALLHDIGKKSTSVFDPKKGRISALGHEKAGEELAGPILKRLKFSNKVADSILWLVANHMKMHHFLEIGDVKKAALIRNPMFDTLIDLTSADSRSTGKEDPAPELREFVKNAPDRLRASEPLIDGNDLRKLGLRPGPDFKKILDKVSDKQTEGTIETKEDALRFASNMIKSLQGIAKKESLGTISKQILGICKVGDVNETR